MGLNMWISIVVMDVCAVVYTSLGGIKSVIWTDVFQSLIMFIGLIAIIVKGTIETGGTAKVWELAKSGKRLEIFNFDPDPTTRHTLWTTFLPRILASFGYLFNQSTVQRVSASKSVTAAKRMTLLTALMYPVVFLLVIYQGIVVFAYFNLKGDEPLSCGYITNANQILPYAVLVMFENMPGMAGLFIATLFSASLSTISSDLSSMSVMLMEDIFKPYLKNTPEKQATIYAKLSVVCLGAGCLVFTVLVTHAQGPLHQITASVLSAFDAPLVGLFTMACFLPSINKRAAVIGIVVGTLMSGTLSLGSIFSPDVKTTPWLPLADNKSCITRALNSTSQSIALNISSTMTSYAPYSFQSTTTNPTTAEKSYNQFFSLSYLLFSPLGVVTTLTVAVISSFIFGRNKPGDVNPKYFLEVSDSLLIFLPPPIRRWIKGFGPQFKKGWKHDAGRRHGNIEIDVQPFTVELGEKSKEIP